MDNYFELYGLTPTFAPDKDVVRAKFYEISRLYHPDRFAQADTAAQLHALAMAAQNNKAYKALSDADATMAHVLRLHGLLEEEEKYALPPAFLMDMMDLNEAISDYEMNPADTGALQQARTTLHDHLDAWQQMATPLTTSYDPTQADEAVLARIKDIYYRKKYLLRIQERISKFAAR